MLKLLLKAHGHPGNTPLCLSLPDKQRGSQKESENKPHTNRHCAQTTSRV